MAFEARLRAEWLRHRALRTCELISTTADILELERAAAVAAEQEACRLEQLEMNQQQEHQQQNQLRPMPPSAPPPAHLLASEHRVPAAVHSEQHPQRQHLCTQHFRGFCDICSGPVLHAPQIKRRRLSDAGRDRKEVPSLLMRLAFDILEASHARVTGTWQAHEYAESCYAAYSNVATSFSNGEAFIEGKALGLAARLLKAHALEFLIVGESETLVGRRNFFVETFQEYLWDVIPTEHWGIRLTWSQCYWIAAASVAETITKCKALADQIGIERCRTKLAKILWQD